ncbi:MAG TPA: MFS transporter [Spirochaetia bacterium]|nr:MFS transporter [Spirochaetia bacterium]
MRVFNFNELHPATRRLLFARALRSVGQGTLVVDFALYLNALHWSGVAIGLVLSASGLFGAALSLLIGVGSDSIRRKPFLLVYESIAAIGSIIAFLTAQPVLLSVVAILGAFGRGANGAAGPFSPAEQAWLAEQVAADRRGVVYSLNSALGFFGMTLGALLAALPAVWQSALPGAAGFRPLFLIVTLSSVANLWLLARTQEDHQPVDRSRKHQRTLSGSRTRRDENSALLKLVLVNAFNGAAVGLTGPLIAYWFARKFGIGPSSLGPVFAVTFLVTGFASLLTGSLSQKMGIVRSVVAGRLIGLVLLVLLPLIPAYWLAALVYLLRSALNRGTAGARQALAIGLVTDERRGLASSLNTVSMQLPQSIGPSVAGALLDAGYLALPFYAAALLQGAYLLFYQRVFRRYETEAKR